MRYQQIAMLDKETGELMERRLEHASGQARTFYAGLAPPVRVGIEATGNTRWFERMLAVAQDDPTRRYIRNGRDLAEYVHYDFAYQSYLSAALILINSGPRSILNCNQFKSGNNPYRYSTVEEGFVTFGPAEVTDWLGRVTTAALKAAYFQKWLVHRRVRPEAPGGLIHQTRLKIQKYPVHPSLVESEAVNAVFSRTGSYLLPQAYPEGCPFHPSYPSGHAAIAGGRSAVADQE
jgi:hypothetical protein